MSCLLPPFKCCPDAFAVNFKSQSNYLIHTSKARDSVVLRTQGIFSATSTTIELEKLQLPSLGHSRPDNDPDDRSWNTSLASATAVRDFPVDLEIADFLIESAVSPEKLILDPREVGHIGSPFEFKETPEKKYAREQATNLRTKLNPGTNLEIR